MASIVGSWRVNKWLWVCDETFQPQAKHGRLMLVVWYFKSSQKTVGLSDTRALFGAAGAPALVPHQISLPRWSRAHVRCRAKGRRGREDGADV